MSLARRKKESAPDHEKVIGELRAKLAEAQDLLHAIRGGEVDALVVATPEGDRIFTLQGAETPYRVIVENISEGAATLLPDGLILYANAAFSQILGSPLEQIIGTPLQAYLPEPDRSRVPELLAKSLSRTVRREITVQRAAERVPLFVSLRRLPLNDDTPGISMVATDISERKQAEEELLRAHDELDARVRARTRELDEANISLKREIAERKRAENELKRVVTELERSNKELQEFAYVASHDLQEPLRTVSSYVDLLAERYHGKLDEKADRYISFAVDGAKRMSALINDLLAYSRVSTRGERFVTVDMDAVVNEAIANLRSAITGSGAKIIAEQLPLVHGDRRQLTQLVQNLVSNALKFRRPDVRPTVGISASGADGEWIFRVEDNGIGIEPRFFERIFTIFQRLHTLDEYAGTGVGLAICKRIVDRHHGRIWVESRPGAGTTFFFTLPARENVSGEKSDRKAD